jgi:hypothetical protein
MTDQVSGPLRALVESKREQVMAIAARHPRPVRRPVSRRDGERVADILDAAGEIAAIIELGRDAWGQEPGN